jgi:hypothetical protein
VIKDDDYELSGELYNYSRDVAARLRVTRYVYEEYEYRGLVRAFLGVYDFEVEPNLKYPLQQSMDFIKSVLFNLPDFADFDWKSAATREAVIQARVGQGIFRDDLGKLWGGKCAVTGVSTRELLRASHIKPWAVSSVEQKLDPENGLLLIANLDALFDKYLISFDADGNILIAPRIEKDMLSVIPNEAKLRKIPSQKTRDYLTEHRERFYSLNK